MDIAKSFDLVVIDCLGPEAHGSAFGVPQAEAFDINRTGGG
jgi:hypothetical protein